MISAPPPTESLKLIQWMEEDDVGEIQQKVQVRMPPAGGNSLNSETSSEATLKLPLLVPPRSPTCRCPLEHIAMTVTMRQVASVGLRLAERIYLLLITRSQACSAHRSRHIAPQRRFFYLCMHACRVYCAACRGPRVAACGYVLSSWHSGYPFEIWF